MQTLLQIGVTNAIAAAMLALVALALSGICRKPAITRGLWLLVLLKLITPPVWTIHCNWPLAKSNESAASQLADKSPLQTPVPEINQSDVALDSSIVENDPTDDSLVDSLPATGQEPIQPSDRALSSNTQNRWLAITLSKIPIIWAFGSLACLLLAAIRIGQVHRIFAISHRAPLDVQLMAGNLAKRFAVRRGVEVWFVPGAVCPTLWAFSSTPRILLPQKLWQQLDHGQRSAVIAHELAHLLRRDHWVRLIELAATALYWWHPVLWWARRELNDAEEQCCDAWVLWAIPDAVRSYGAAILDTVDFVSTNRSAQPALGSTLGEFRHLKRRLLMIRQGNVARAMSGYALLAVCAVGGLALTVAPTIAQQEPPPTPDVKQQREQADQELRAQQQAELAQARAQEAKAQAERAMVDQQRALADQERAQAMLAQAQAQAALAAANAQRAQNVRGRLMDATPEVAEARQHVQNLRRQLAEAERHLAEIAPDDPALRRPQGQIMNGRVAIRPPARVGNPGEANNFAPQINPPVRADPQYAPMLPPGEPQAPAYRPGARPPVGMPMQPGAAPQDARRLDQIEKQLQELAAAVRDLRSQNNAKTPSPRDNGDVGLPKGRE